MKTKDYITPMLRVTGIRHAQMVAASEMSGTAAGYGDGYDMLNDDTAQAGTAGGYGSGQSVFGDD